jgi:ribosomal protein S18 acetylase RimI-like enzyme
MLSITDASSGDVLLQARSLFEEYAAALRVELCFQGFAQELASLPGSYAPPRGRLLLARWNRKAAGCVALRPLHHGICEMKRLYVRPAYRGHGVGRALIERIIEDAGQAGYASIRLDSLPSMKRALQLYRELGFQDIPPYSANPVSETVFLELTLARQTTL